MGALDVGSWLDAALTAQSSFVLGFICMAAAVVMRRKTVLKSQDAMPLAKVAFNLCFPAMLFANTWKQDVDSSLLRLAAVSIVVHTLQVLIALAISTTVPTRNGFRGQWIQGMCGLNIGFLYPLLLASEHADSVFPAAVVWDVSGNVPVVFGFNYFIAMVNAPKKTASHETAPGVAALEEVGISGAPPTAPLPEEWPEQGEADVKQVTVDVPKESAPEEASVDSAATRVAEAIGAGAGLSSSPEPRRSLVASTCAVVRKVTSNPPLLGVMGGFLTNISGMTVPRSIDAVLQGVGAPFPVLFFLLVGVNLEWSRVRPQLGRISGLIFCRLFVAALLACSVLAVGVLPTRAMRMAMLLTLFCPVSGLSMGYVLEFGYDQALQAALMASSNVVSFVILWALMTFA